MSPAPKSKLVEYSHLTRQSCAIPDNHIGRGRQLNALRHGEPLLLMLEMAGRYAEAIREHHGCSLEGISQDHHYNHIIDAWTTLMRGLYGLLHGPGADCMALGMEQDSKDTAACLWLWERVVERAGFTLEEILLNSTTKNHERQPV